MQYTFHIVYDAYHSLAALIIIIHYAQTYLGIDSRYRVSMPKHTSVTTFYKAEIRPEICYTPVPQ